MKCNKCERPMRKIDRRDEMAELNDGATGGQMADYFAAEESGDWGAWNEGIIEYHCKDCDLYLQLVLDELPNYRPLIEAWHDKAAEGDTFSRFVFQYLAFIAHIKNELYFDAPSDRMAIQRLKRDSKIKHAYLHIVKNNDDLRRYWNEIIKELHAKPLHNSSRDPDYPEIDKWWNNTEDRPSEKHESPKGMVHSLEDWSNMVEYWYSIRNNLFHGGKNPNIDRDALLVERAFLTLRALVHNEFITGKASYRDL